MTIHPTAQSYIHLCHLKAIADTEPSHVTEEAYIETRSSLVESNRAAHHSVVSSLEWTNLYLTLVQAKRERVSPIVAEHSRWSIEAWKREIRDRFFPGERLPRVSTDYDEALPLKLGDSHRLLAMDRQDWEHFQGRAIGLYGKRYAMAGHEFIHRYVARQSFPNLKGMLVDHKNQNTFDCRRSNLRPCTKSENSRNRGPQVNNSSNCGYKGVAKYEEDYYRAQIALDGKTKCIGFFTTPKQAALAYDIYAKRYHGEFAVINFPDVSQAEVDEVMKLLMSNKTRRGLSSKYYGVCWHKASGKWRGDVRFNKTHHYLGYFTDEVEAAKAVDQCLLKIGRREMLNFGRTEADVIRMP